MLEKFKNAFKPAVNCKVASDEMVKQYEGKVPEILLDVWKSSGFGKYNDGLIELINPKDFESILWTWIGK